MPKCVISFRVRRVSSHRMRFADFSASTARGEKSERLPIGVPTMSSLPFIECSPQQDSCCGSDVERFDASRHLDSHQPRHLANAVGHALAFAAEDQDAARQLARTLGIGGENRTLACEQLVDCHFY